MRLLLVYGMNRHNGVLLQRGESIASNSGPCRMAEMVELLTVPRKLWVSMLSFRRYFITVQLAGGSVLMSA